MIPFWKKTGKHSKPQSAQKRRQKAKPAVPRTAQQSIPMQRMFEDGTCRVKANYYTRTIQYQDINYQLAQQEDKTAIFEEWCSFLNFFDEMLSVLVDAWGGDSDSFLSSILHGMARFLALYQGEYSRERLILRLRTVHPKTITRLAQNDTGNVADRHMKQILSIYNGAGRTHNLPCKR